MSNAQQSSGAERNGLPIFPEESSRGNQSGEDRAGRPGSRAFAPGRVWNGGGWLCGDDAEFRATLGAIRVQPAPAGPIEGLLIDRLLQAAWRLRRVAQAEAAGAVDDMLLRIEALAERTLFRSLHELEARRARRGADPEKAGPIAAPPDSSDANSPAPDHRPDCLDVEPPHPEEDEDDPGSWRGRLSLDLNISEDSPVVRGTWITVNHIISLVVDGWTWTDILRSHPELNEDDLRACLAYHVQEERDGSRPPA